MHYSDSMLTCYNLYKIYRDFIKFDWIASFCYARVSSDISSKGNQYLLVGTKCHETCRYLNFITNEWIGVFLAVHMWFMISRL